MDNVQWQKIKIDDINWLKKILQMERCIHAMYISRWYIFVKIVSLRFAEGLKEDNVLRNDYREKFELDTELPS